MVAGSGGLRARVGEGRRTRAAGGGGRGRSWLQTVATMTKAARRAGGEKPPIGGRGGVEVAQQARRRDQRVADVHVGRAATRFYSEMTRAAGEAIRNRGDGYPRFAPTPAPAAAARSDRRGQDDERGPIASRQALRDEQGRNRGGAGGSRAAHRPCWRGEGVRVATPSSAGEAGEVSERRRSHVRPRRRGAASVRVRRAGGAVSAACAGPWPTRPRASS